MIPSLDENSLKRYFLRYACPRNPHLRQANGGFSVCASLTNPLFIEFSKSTHSASFGVWLDFEMLTYSEYAPLSQSSTSLKIVSYL